MINTEALQEALDFITTHPARWDQGTWAVVDGGTPKRGQHRVAVECGSTACLAGEVVLLHGYVLIAEPYIQSQMVNLCAKREYVDEILWGRDVANNIGETARAVLGLSPHQADMLFWGGNSLTGLWALAFEFTEGRIQLPAYLPAAFRVDDDGYRAPTEPVANVPAAVLTWWVASSGSCARELSYALSLHSEGHLELSSELRTRLEGMANQVALTPK